MTHCSYYTLFSIVCGWGQWLSRGCEGPSSMPSSFLILSSFFDIVQDLKLFNVLNFDSAYCVMIVLLVKPPPHGVELPEGISGWVSQILMNYYWSIFLGNVVKVLVSRCSALSYWWIFLPIEQIIQQYSTCFSFSDFITVKPLGSFDLLRYR